MHTAAVRWAETAWRRRVVGVRRLTGGITSTMLCLEGRDGGRAVLRIMHKEPWRRHAAELLAREAAVQRLLGALPASEQSRLAKGADTDAETSGVAKARRPPAPGNGSFSDPSCLPVPRSIGLDVRGEFAGEPAHLMSWLPGRLRLDSAAGCVLAPLAGLLTDIHRVEPGVERPREYQSWATAEKRIVPAWAQQRELWEKAFALLAGEPPPYAGAFLHRDFHLGNVLWMSGRVSGVVDWVEASWGPADLDVAHAATYLSMLHGVGAAGRFVAAYRQAGGSLAAADEFRYWSVLDIVGYLPDPGKVVQPWRDAGLTMNDQLARHRLEQHLHHVLSGST